MAVLAVVVCANVVLVALAVVAEEAVTGKTAAELVAHLLTGVRVIKYPIGDGRQSYVGNDYCYVVKFHNGGVGV